MRRLALVFSFGSSLEGWKNKGILKRDLLLYQLLQEQGWVTDFITYGSARDNEVLPREFLGRVLSRPEGMDEKTYARSLYCVHGKDLKNVSLVKSHQSYGSGAAAWLAWWIRKPFYLRCGYINSYFFRELGMKPRRIRAAVREEFLAFNFCKVAAVPSWAEAEYVRRKFKTPLRKFQIHPNWIDCDAFSVATNPERYRSRKVCCIGRLDKQKQPLLLLEALAAIPDIHLFLVGDGPMAGEVERFLNWSQLSCEWFRQIDNEQLPDLLGRCALFALPTLFEGGSPKVVLEAMAAGLPVISTNGFGINECFEHQTHGLKVPAGEMLPFRNAVQQLLGDPEKCRIMGQAGACHVRSHYTEQQSLDREMSILRKLSP